jgi:hypothetical protein
MPFFQFLLGCSRQIQKNYCKRRSNPFGVQEGKPNIKIYIIKQFITISFKKVFTKGHRKKFRADKKARRQGAPPLRTGMDVETDTEQEADSDTDAGTILNKH